MQQSLNHLAIIMDGNARWATLNGKTKAEGHSVGAQNAEEIIPHALELGVKYLTLYAFSSENWRRPIKEVSILIGLLNKYLNSKTDFLKKHEIRLQVIGNLSKLPAALVAKINKSTEDTRNNTKMTVTIAFSYGARAEIANACQKAIDSGVKEITEDNFKNFLYDPAMPDVDILIRTGGLHRISNFLLWQASYAEIYFLDKFWPDFNKEDLAKTIEDYSKRTRSFGAR
jgi:undecaprenyl diphosphate synthase